MEVHRASVEVRNQKGGALGRYFCSAPNPDHPEEVWCRRQTDHPDEHAAFVFSITTPESWT